MENIEAINRANEIPSRSFLSRLEFGVMRCLWQRPGKAISRVDLLEEVLGV